MNETHGILGHKFQSFPASRGLLPGFPGIYIVALPQTTQDATEDCQSQAGTWDVLFVGHTDSVRDIQQDTVFWAKVLAEKDAHILAECFDANSRVTTSNHLISRLNPPWNNENS